MLRVDSTYIFGPYIDDLYETARAQRLAQWKIQDLDESRNRLL